MRIAVVDVAASSGGAVSVLLDFLDYIQSGGAFSRAQEWIVYTSMKLEIKAPNVRNIVIPEIKKSWFHRLYWEQFRSIREFAEKNIDVVISLQNTAFKKGSYKQITYFHNVLLLEAPEKYSLLKAAERKYAVYTRFISRYTLQSLRNADHVIVQTKTVRDALLKRERCLNVEVIRPNVHIDEKYKDTAEFPIRGLIYPVSAAPFKRVEEIVDCVRTNHEWFIEHDFEVLITLSGEENEYARMIKSRIKGLAATIQLVGFLKRDVLMSLYKNHALVACSELESYPLPFIEAAYVGAPVIAADYPYVKECISGAFLYTPGDLKGLMQCIETAAGIGALQGDSADFSENTWELIVPMIGNRTSDDCCG